MASEAEITSKIERGRTWRAGAAVQLHGEHRAVGERARHVGRHVVQEAAVHQQPAVERDGLEDARYAAAGPDRAREVARAEHHLLARADVDGDRGEGEEEALEALHPDRALEEAFQALGGEHAHPRHDGLHEVRPSQAVRLVDHPAPVAARGQRGTDDGAHARAGHGAHGDAFFGEHLQRTDVGDAPRGAAAEGERDTGGPQPLDGGHGWWKA